MLRRNLSFASGALLALSSRARGNIFAPALDERLAPPDVESINGWTTEDSQGFVEPDVESINGWTTEDSQGFVAESLDPPDVESINGGTTEDSQGFVDPDVESINGWTTEDSQGFVEPDVESINGWTTEDCQGFVAEDLAWMFGDAPPACSSFEDGFFDFVDARIPAYVTDAASVQANFDVLFAVEIQMWEAQWGARRLQEGGGEEPGGADADADAAPQPPNYNEEKWGLLHCLWHSVLSSTLGVPASVLFSLVWEYIEHTAIPHLDPQEALNDIFFWDRLGDLPGPLIVKIIRCFYFYSLMK